MNRMSKRLFTVYHANLSKNATVLKEKVNTKTWHIHAYGDINELQLGTQRVPVIKNPDDVLVQVAAASVNSIDLLMLGGYGRTLFKIPRSFELEFPLTLGRDFSGIVVAKGHGVGDKVCIGDEVYGFIPIHKQGSFSEIVLAEKNHLLRKPNHLSHAESASLVYATMTAWSALFIFGNLLFKQKQGLRVLVLGASGGVGTVAIQLLKSQDCAVRILCSFIYIDGRLAGITQISKVYGTCSTDAVAMVQSLGANRVFDYKSDDFEKQVELEGRYHIILDGAKVGHQNIPKNWKYDSYITLNSPLLINTDNYGLIGGLVYSVNNLLEANLKKFRSGSTVKWGFFVPSSKGFEFIDGLISAEKIKPVVHKAFKFEELPEAFKMLAEGHLRGKLVIDFNK